MGGRIPNAASVNPTILYTAVNARFILTIRIVRRAFELGINLFDTADVYVRGGAETLLGKALTGLPREQVVIATKVMGRVWDGPLGAGLSRKHIFDAMDQSLRRLGVDYVDLYQAHAPHAESPIEETLRAFEDLVRMGKARYVGFSNFDREPALARKVVEIQTGRGWDAMISSQPRYSLLDRHVEEEHVAFCAKHGIANCDPAAFQSAVARWLGRDLTNAEQITVKEASEQVCSLVRRERAELFDQ